jgi:hypothetical protein
MASEHDTAVAYAPDGDAPLVTVDVVNGGGPVGAATKKRGRAAPVAASDAVAEAAGAGGEAYDEHVVLNVEGDGGDAGPSALGAKPARKRRVTRKADVPPAAGTCVRLGGVGGRRRAVGRGTEQGPRLLLSAVRMGGSLPKA